MSKILLPLFFSRAFIITNTFGLIHFECAFVCGVSALLFHSFIYSCLVSSAPLIEETVKTDLFLKM